jgi:hypothetical protein
MLDFTEQAVSTTSLPELSPDTPTVSDNLPVTREPVHYSMHLEGLGDPETTASEAAKLLSTPSEMARTLAALAPWLSEDKKTFVQDEEEPVEV